MRQKRTYKNVKCMGKVVDNISLYTLLTKSAYHNKNGWVRITLKEYPIEAIAEVVGGHNLTKMERNIECLIDNNTHIGGIAKRLMYDVKRDCWSYCAGQDYTAEIASLRKLIRSRS